jgi:GDPmannose 4,6-dehydratase
LQIGEKMPSKRALIFGISGQDGAYLAHLLLSKGYEVHGSSRDVATTSFGGLKQLGVERKVKLHSASPTDMHSVLTLFKAVKPKEVYNLSGQNSVSLSFEQPLETNESINQANLNILEAIRFSGFPVRFFNASSGECFGDTGIHLADEKTPFYPRSPYGVAKAAAYWMAVNYREAYGVYVCSGIMFNHESPLRSERFVTRKVIAAAARIAAGSREVLRLGNIGIRRDWGWAPDYVEAMWRMLQKPTPEDYVIATGKPAFLKDFVREAFSVFDLKWKDHVKLDAALIRPSEIIANGGNASKARKKLGWKPTLTLKGIVSAMADAEVVRMKHR